MFTAPRDIDGGIKYYSSFAHPLSTSPGYFPIGVWLAGVHSQQDVDLDKAVGINVYVGITANSNFSLVAQNGLRILAQADELRTNSAIIKSTATAGWSLDDEIDMELGPSGITRLLQIIASLPADRRLRYNNYGKGVLIWQTVAEAAKYVNAVDLVSADFYWFTDPNAVGAIVPWSKTPLTSAQAKLAANYGYSIDRLRALDATDGKRRPIWGFTEVGWPFTESAAQGGRAISPAEINASVWHQIIAGARGIIYFNHSFGGPNQTQNVLRDPAYAAHRAQVTKTNALIRQLAPVLNSPFDDSLVTVNSPLRAMAKSYNGAYYVFAGNKSNGVATATFRVPLILTGTAVVIGENRSIPIANGRFVDTFANGNTIHIYRLYSKDPIGL